VLYERRKTHLPTEWLPDGWELMPKASLRELSIYDSVRLKSVELPLGALLTFNIGLSDYPVSTKNAGGVQVGLSRSEGISLGKGPLRGETCQAVALVVQLNRLCEFVRYTVYLCNFPCTGNYRGRYDNLP